MNHSWIVGSGGLLGSAVKKILQQNTQHLLFEPTQFDWTKPDLLAVQLREAANAFAETIDKTEPWELYWMAGRGTMNSDRSELQQETQALLQILESLAKHPVIKEAIGTIVFASSAGGIYAGSTDEQINEASAVSPLSLYGEEKLKQEELIRTWADAHPKTSVLIARLSTLYGPKQSHGKKQGLLTHIARSILRREPVHIFVPLDTIRDYMHVRDAAQELLRCLETIRGTGTLTTKIIAAEEPATIAQIIRLFRHVTRVAPRIITGTGVQSARYPRRQCFRSTVIPRAAEQKRTNLLCGIAEMLASERLAMAGSR